MGEILMDPLKSIEEVNLIAALLCDVQNAHGVVFNSRARKLTLNKISKRVRTEGLGFLTKTLPRLGKAFDKALTESASLNAVELGFKPLPNSKLPMLFGELFREVLNHDGTVLQNPCVTVVATLRLLLLSFYKYELPYEAKQAQKVLSQFEKTEKDISDVEPTLHRYGEVADLLTVSRRDPSQDPAAVVAKAREILKEVFSHFDPTDIVPRHGPGAVATKQQRSAKYLWDNVCSRITDYYPLDAYFYASLGHICDNHRSFSRINDKDLPAKVILVPKDSRGPRLISCEPVDFQWIQQGLAQAIVRRVESHEFTQFNVNFTHQYPNQCGALLGSSTGKYATLDLKEASDRVSIGLVRLLFPPNLVGYLEASRSLATVLPDGRILPLRKFAPMGSALCFPILALTIWSILTAAAPDSWTRKRLLVYGDDVIVPTAYAANAIEQLETFGLLVNRDKSCTSGLFRESCGVDAYKGYNVTPVRFRTVWSSSPSPEVYESWIAYANQLYDRQYFTTYDLIVGRLRAIYGPIPGEDLVGKTAPSLRDSPDSRSSFRRRVNVHLQKMEYYVYVTENKDSFETIDGWSMLLRYLTETANKPPLNALGETSGGSLIEPFSVRLYTKRYTGKLVKRWR